jgi:sulfopyruvate decarboxylase subunit alpha
LGVHETIAEALKRADISPSVAVPCKNLAPLLLILEKQPERMVIYPAREEEGLGICAGAYLAGSFPILICQNSGLGNLVNGYCSLNQFYEIPVFLLVSHRGDEREKIAAQKPMGEISKRLLDLLGIENHTLDRPDQASQVLGHLEQYRRQRRSRALLLPSGFWQE